MSTDTLNERLARHQLTANLTLAHHVDSMACVPGHRAQIAIERGVDPEMDLTDCEHDEECLARATFTDLEIRQMERKDKR